MRRGACKSTMNARAAEEEEEEEENGKSWK